MQSLLVPSLMKKPVPQPNPAMFQYPPAGMNRPDTRALPSMIKVIGFVAVASAMAALIRGPSSVAVPPECLLCPVRKSQSRAQPIFEAQMYVIPRAGAGGDAGPRQGISTWYSAQPKMGALKMPDATMRPVLAIKERRLIDKGLCIEGFHQG